VEVLHGDHRVGVHAHHAMLASRLRRRRKVGTCPYAESSTPERERVPGGGLAQPGVARYPQATVEL
jgi:hypothetical protein